MRTSTAEARHQFARDTVSANLREVLTLLNDRDQKSSVE